MRYIYNNGCRRLYLDTTAVLFYLTFVPLVVAFLVTDLRSSELTEIPSNIPEETTELYANNNDIENVDPDKFIGLILLWKLEIKVNSLQAFPNLTQIRNSLTELNLEYNAISYIDPDLLNTLLHLRCLKLSNNFLSTFPDVPGPSESLEELVLTNNLFTSFPRMSLIGKTLKALEMLYNSLQSFPLEQTEGLNAIEYLHLDGNQIETYPDLSDLTDTLKEVRLNNNAMKTISPERFYFAPLGNVNYTINVYLNDNLLTQIPPVSGDIDKVRLNLNNNNLICDKRMAWLIGMEGNALLLIEGEGESYYYEYDLMVGSRCTTSDNREIELTDLTYYDLGMSEFLNEGVMKTASLSSKVKKNSFINCTPLSIIAETSRINCQLQCLPLTGCTFFNIKCTAPTNCTCYWSDVFSGQAVNTPQDLTGWNTYLVN